MASPRSVGKILLLSALVVLLLRAVLLQQETARRRPAHVFGDSRPTRATVPGAAESYLKFVGEVADAADAAEAREKARAEAAAQAEAAAAAAREKAAATVTTTTPPPLPPPTTRPADPTPKEECAFMMQKHGVRPGESWGGLGPNGQKRWTRLDCDAHTRGARSPSRAASDAAYRASLPSSAGIALERCPAPPSPDQPLVAVCCGTTTRGKQGWITPSELGELAVFHHLLPSFAKTVECGFRYVVVLGYDVGDRFWDLGDGAQRGRQWFEDNVKKILAEKNVEAELRYAVVDNKIKKPGPVFTGITRAAFYDARADYIYRVNDDTELATRWAKRFVAALASMGNVGAVGPACRQGNRRILTHDFTHRKHMEIFEGQYYPPALSDWWMDDWISRVYGVDRTLRADAIEVVHHTGKHGQRYQVDKSHAQLLQGLLVAGAARIRKHLDATNPAPLGAPPPGFSRFAFTGKAPGGRGGAMAPRRPLRRRGGGGGFR